MKSWKVLLILILIGCIAFTACTTKKPALTTEPDAATPGAVAASAAPTLKFIEFYSPL
jgi:hypothetical protein